MFLKTIKSKGLAHSSYFLSEGGEALVVDLRQKQSGELYDSLHEKIFPLGDHAIFYPAHGAGSICFHF
jgi:hydroxyacylglutathione hydrolase